MFCIRAVLYTNVAKTQQPTSIEAFGEISGIGEYKKDKYGKEFVELIKKKIGK